MGKPPKAKERPADASPPEGFREATPAEEAIVKANHEKAKKNQEEVYKRDGMEIRTYVLHVALSMENRISDLLGELLEINVKESHVIGYRANPISFNQKVWFLIDIGAIKGEDFKDIQRFMEIRNMLMHNLSARSLTDCFRMMSEKDSNESAMNRILGLADAQIPKLFKTADPWTLERRLDLGVRIFVDQVAKKTEQAVTVLGERTLEQVDHIASKEHREKFVHLIKKPAFEQAQKVVQGLTLSYSRKEVVQMLEDTANATRELYRTSFKEELIKQINVIRTKAGMDPISDLPADEVDDAQKG